MPIVVGINFKPAGRIYSFDPGDLELGPGDVVVTETSRGPEVGFVKHRAREIADADVVPPLKRVLRLATEADHGQVAANAERAEQGLADRARARRGPRPADEAAPLRVCVRRPQVPIYFAAEGRIDFRELVKDLAAALRTRIQLHQVGARDAAKLMGGIGPCGRALCCSTWLTAFEPVSMKMAKEQSLFLNPTKFSGVCGKLMCCLRYEYDYYRETKAQIPVLGGDVETSDGRGKIIGHNVIREP